MKEKYETPNYPEFIEAKKKDKEGLKTLKDLQKDKYCKNCNGWECYDNFHNKYIFIEIDKLKAEAVKWINKHRDNLWKWTEDTWIDFFNLTEEDLGE